MKARKKKRTRIVWRPQKAIIEAETKKGKVRYLTIRRPIVTEIDYTKNPDIFTIATFGEKQTLKAVGYKKDPFKVTVFCNKSAFELNVFRQREFFSFINKISWYLGLYGKKAKKWRRSMSKSH